MGNKHSSPSSKHGSVTTGGSGKINNKMKVEIIRRVGQNNGSNDDGVAISGISLQYFIELVKKTKFNNNNNKTPPTMNELVEQMIKPKTKSKQESLLQHIAKEQPSAIQSTADYFVSYVWSYPLQELISALEYTLLKKLNQQDVYIWLDGLCVNQHMKSTATPEQLQLTFGEALKAIGKVAMVLVDWQDPSYPRRTWCVFEAYMAKLHQVEVTLAMSPNEETSLVKTIQEDMNYTIFNYENLTSYFGSVNVETAKAKQVQDQETILKLIHEFGVAKVNGVVLDNLKQWIVHGGEVALSGVEQNSKEATYICVARGALHRALGEHHDELKWLDQALKIWEQIPNRAELGKATILDNKGVCLVSLKQYDEALQAHEEALTIFIRIHGQNHSDVAICLNNKGVCLRSAGRNEEALKAFDETLTVKLKLYGLNNLSTTRTLSNRAGCLEIAGQFTEALDVYNQVLAIDMKLVGPNDPEVATDLNNKAVCLKSLNRSDEANQLGKQALHIIERSLGPTHPSTIQLRKDWGVSS
jgi:tetratricopeptide (TPR) repeat protein